MKRKEDVPSKDRVVESVNRQETADPIQQKSEKSSDNQKVFLMEDGRLKPFSSDDYTSATLYQMVDSYSVECRLVRPEDPTNPVYEGKKPSKKTVPIIIAKDGDTRLLESWESLDSNPEQLSDAMEVIGATPVKQVFVLKRKEE